MNPERHEQIKSLFLAACEMDERAREAFLDQACRDDRGMRDEVVSLLRHHQPGTIMKEMPPAAPGSAGREADDLETCPAPAGDLPSPRQQDQTPPRFQAGDLVSGRYRIVSLLGRGGMGEVYRADDLKLIRPVALKFLIGAGRAAPARLTKFYTEARLASGVTHRNVCRVYDLGEAEGDVFLSMEYVDGEDLGSLLRRIGRVPADKVGQIARQLCFGLGAAHDAGVIHRDLKPANIMLDGQGRVRITDFGIAALAGPPAQRPQLAGTPPYMAPELLEGRPATVRSDLYSVGLILFELLTGRSPFDDDDITRAKPTAPSAYITDLDPRLEEAILGCLQRRPADRPRSVYKLLAALPGGDPLEDALAAGETPAPEIIAAARSREVSGRTLPVLCTVAALVGLAIITSLADRTFLLSSAALDKPPDVLQERAEQVVERLHGSGSTERGTGQFVIDQRGLGYLEHRASPGAGSRRAGEIDLPVVFYRFVRGSRAGPAADSIVYGRLVPDFSESARVIVRLDSQGKLLGYLTDGMPDDPAAPGTSGPDWSTAFELAGLSMAEYQAVPPREVPPSGAETRLAWEAVAPREPGVPPRVEGVAVGDRIIHFARVAPWESGVTAGEVDRETSRGQRLSRILMVFFWITFVGCLVLSWKSAERGPIDRRAAWRFAMLMLCLQSLRLAVLQPLPAAPALGLDILLHVARYAVFAAVAAWIYYASLERFFRRFWPHAIISWVRVMTGRIRDPLVGRDVLAGVALGLGMVGLQQINVLVTAWAGGSVSLIMPSGIEPTLGRLVGFRHLSASLLHSGFVGIILGLILATLLLILRSALRNPRLAAIAFVLIVMSASAWVWAPGLYVSWVTGGLFGVVMAGILQRLGILCAVVSTVVAQIVVNNPLTDEFDAWYAGPAWFVIGGVVVLIAAGLYLTTAPSSRSPSLARAS